VAIDPDTGQVTEIYNVGKIYSTGNIPLREVNALEDISAHPYAQGAEIYYIPYNAIE